MLPIKNRKCIICRQSLVPIGSSRRNGNSRIHDWDTRDMHKNCYKQYIKCDDDEKEYLIKYGRNLFE